MEENLENSLEKASECQRSRFGKFEKELPEYELLSNKQKLCLLKLCKFDNDISDVVDEIFTIIRKDTKALYYNSDHIKKDSIKIDESTLFDLEQNKLTVRYSLEVELKNEDKDKDNLIVIMMNPSKATKIYSDKTVNKVIQYAFKTYGKLIVLNCLPFYETDSKKLVNVLESVKENEIKKVLKKT